MCPQTAAKEFDAESLSKKEVTENDFKIVCSSQQYPVLFEVMFHEQKTWWILGRLCMCSLPLAAWPCSSSVQVGAIQTNSICAWSWQCAFP